MGSAKLFQHWLKKSGDFIFKMDTVSQTSFSFFPSQNLHACYYPFFKKRSPQLLFKVHLSHPSSQSTAIVRAHSPGSIPDHQVLHYPLTTQTILNQMKQHPKHLIQHGSLTVLHHDCHPATSVLVVVHFSSPGHAPTPPAEQPLPVCSRVISNTFPSCSLKTTFISQFPNRT
jgi:hypothetical protein